MSGGLENEKIISNQLLNTSFALFLLINFPHFIEVKNTSAILTFQWR
jgi:hypothetical protein